MNDQREYSNEELGAMSVARHEHPNWIELFRDRLAGRWAVALPVSILAGCLASLACWYVVPARYESSGLIEVDARRGVVVSRLPEESESSRTFTMYLQNQINLIRSERVREAAIESPELRSLRLTRSGESLIDSIERNLEVSIPSRSYQIRVGYTDTSPLAAVEVTNAVMLSYIEIHGNSRGSELDQTSQNLRLEKQANRDRLQAKRDELQDLIRRSQDGMGDVSGVMQRLAEERQTMLADQERIQEVMSTLERSSTDAGIGVAEMTGEEMPVPSQEELEAFDPRLVAMREAILRDQNDLDKIRPRLKESHRLVRKLTLGIETQQRSLEDAIEEARSRWYAGPGQELSYRNLQLEGNRLKDRLLTRRERMQQLQRHQAQYVQIQKDVGVLEDDYAKLEDRLTSVEREAPYIGDRIKIVQDATEPVATGNRRMQVAGVAFFGGIAAVLGGFFVIGSVDQRAFAVRQLKSEGDGFQCLGVIPDTTTSDSDPDLLNIAMTCVHRLRNKIESTRTRGEGGYVILITSPFQGDGKTTLATLLGHSYATAGFRTCLVDCDFIGRSLSHHFEELRSEGLKEVILGSEMAGHLVQVDEGKLSLLPIGIDDRVDAAMMQSDITASLLANLRADFDFTIIDTGPLTGSIESTPIATNVDGVLLALRKGRSRTPLRRCVRDLRELGARYLGVVLNYADKSDYRDVSSVSKSIEQVIREESEGIRKKNALAESLRTRGSNTYE